MSNKSPNTTGIKNAAKKKREETLNKVFDALKIMQEESLSINFNSVSNFTGVTKAWLYKQPDIKELILKTRGTFNNILMKEQAIQLNLKNKQIDILTKQNKQLRLQIDELRQQLEVSYAELYKKDN
jgi:hypothetical protein